MPDELMHQHNKELEATFLGSCLNWPDHLDEDWSYLPDETFYVEYHRKFWREMRFQHDTGHGFDLTTIAAAFHERQDYDTFHQAYLHIAGVGLSDYHPCSIYAPEYARRLTRFHVTRERAHTIRRYEAAIQRNPDDPDARIELEMVLHVLDGMLNGDTDRSDEQLAREMGNEGRYPTGFSDIDSITGGFARPGLNVVAARPSVGKALAVGTLIPTPVGMKLMGELEIGDSVFGSNGRPTQITNATDVMTGRPCYRVSFDDGTSIIADADHQWATHTRNPRNGVATYTTSEISRTLTAANGERLNHAIPAAGPLQYAHADLLLDPYVFGVWLGDGTTSSARVTIANRDADIINAITNRGVAVGPGAPQPGCATYRLGNGDRSQAARDTSIQATLRSMGVLGKKHIPTGYLEASYNQRIALLQGIVDTDGYVDKGGRVEISVNSERLARNILQLVRSLGHVPTLRNDPARLYGRDAGRRHRVWFVPLGGQPVATVPFKATRLGRTSERGEKRASVRRIVSVEPCDSVPVRCIEVAASDHLYLAGDAFIPTHNSAFARSVIRRAAARGDQVLWYSKDQAAGQIYEMEMARDTRQSSATIRALPRERRIAGIQHVRDNVWHGNVTLIDRPIPLTQLVSLTKSTVPDLLVIDYLQILDTGHDKDIERITAASIALKTLASQMRIPILVLAQFNRGHEDGKPSMSNLKGSGQIEQDADQIYALERDTTLNSGSAQEAQIHILKNKTGSTGMARLHWHGQYATFEPATARSAPTGWQGAS